MRGRRPGAAPAHDRSPFDRRFPARPARRCRRPRRRRSRSRPPWPTCRSSMSRSSSRRRMRDYRCSRPARKSRRSTSATCCPMPGPRTCSSGRVVVPGPSCGPTVRGGRGDESDPDRDRGSGVRADPRRATSRWAHRHRNDHRDAGAHLVADLPYVNEAAAVAGAILAPALIARRRLRSARVRIAGDHRHGRVPPGLSADRRSPDRPDRGLRGPDPVRDRGRPGRVFADAAKVGLGTELEAATLAAAVRDAARLPPDAWLSLNVSPAFLGDADARRQSSPTARADRPRDHRARDHHGLRAAPRGHAQPSGPTSAWPSMTPGPASRTSATSSTCGPTSSRSTPA